MTGDKHPEASLGAVLKLERDGAAFFRRANVIAADPRVRQVFDRLAREREEGAGLVEEAAAIPTSCPQCGAARYAFEREFTASMIWGTALASGKAVTQGVQAAIPGVKGDLRAALERLLAREQTLLKEAEGALASAKA